METVKTESISDKISSGVKTAISELEELRVQLALGKLEAKDLYENNLSFLNIGTGEDLTIADLAKIISEIVGFEGKVVYDHSKPDGTPRKLLDVSRINALGWKAKTELRDGIESTYKWFVDN